MMVTPAQRFFSYAGVKLPDLNRQMSPEEIKSAYSIQYPELATAAIKALRLLATSSATNSWLASVQRVDRRFPAPPR